MSFFLFGNFSMSEIPLTNIDATLNPIESARGLPNEHYTSDSVFEEEKQAILFNNWSAIGFAKDIPGGRRQTH
jgi:choline monooxygenase